MCVVVLVSSQSDWTIGEEEGRENEGVLALGI